MSVPERHLPPAGTPGKPAHARGAPVYIHVEAEAGQKAPGTGTPARQPTRAPMPSLANSPAQLGKAGSTSSLGTPPAAKPSAVPPSSTKRVLAPNGQPRKIPMAMDFDAAAASSLEDREMEDAGPLARGDDGDGWTVGSQPVHDKNYSSNNSRVGAFAAAAGRGATAFVEAFRSAVGAHRTSYTNGARR